MHAKTARWSFPKRSSHGTGHSPPKRRDRRQSAPSIVVSQVPPERPAHDASLLPPRRRCRSRSRCRCRHRHCCPRRRPSRRGTEGTTQHRGERLSASWFTRLYEGDCWTRGSIDWPTSPDSCGNFFESETSTRSAGCTRGTGGATSPIPLGVACRGIGSTMKRRRGRLDRTTIVRVDARTASLRCKQLVIERV